MLFPTVICVDNFFDDPDLIVKKSKKFKYKINGLSSGKRSNPLHEKDWEFFNWVNSKIISVIYFNGDNKINYKANTYFDKVKKSDHDNWVHSDNNTVLAAIIFLNKENTAGTSIFKKKGFFSGLLNKTAKEKYDYYKRGHEMNKKEINKIKKAKEFNNNHYEKTFHFEGLYNRLILFDANCFHSFNGMTEAQKNQERLTLISFFTYIKNEGKNTDFPIPKMRTI
tara:strand:+ start:47 stop:718 length:672 start_codon:yes stop_codon:yes gene_type:complete